MFELQSALLFLLSRTAVRSSVHFEAGELRRHNVSFATYCVLATLTRHDDQRLGDLAALADIEMSTLSRLVGTLQARRLVTRRRSGKDARAVRIRITEQGRALAEKLSTAASGYEAALTRGLPAREVQAFRRTLVKIADTVAALADAETDVAKKTRPAGRASAA